MIWKLRSLPLPISRAEHGFVLLWIFRPCDVPESYWHLVSNVKKVETLFQKFSAFSEKLNFSNLSHCVSKLLYEKCCCLWTSVASRSTFYNFSSKTSFSKMNRHSMSYQNIAKKANDLRRVQYKNGDKSPRTLSEIQYERRKTKPVTM